MRVDVHAVFCEVFFNIISMKVYQFYVYDDDFYSANSRVRNERYINVLAISIEEANMKMLEKYPKNGIGKNNFKLKKEVCNIDL